MSVRLVRGKTELLQFNDCGVAIDKQNGLAVGTFCCSPQSPAEPPKGRFTGFLKMSSKALSSPMCSLGIPQNPLINSLLFQRGYVYAFGNHGYMLYANRQR